MSPRFLQEAKQFERAQTQSVMDQLLNVAAGAKPIKTVVHDADNNEAVEVMEGVTLMPASMETKGHTIWRKADLVGADVVLETSDSNANLVEKQPRPASMTIPPEMLANLAKTIQWGDITDPILQKKTLGSLTTGQGGGMNVHIFDEPIRNEEQAHDSQFCSKDECCSYRPPRTHHCR